MLAVFTAMIVALEAVSIPFLTDIYVVGNFTIDWTGIVIFIIFLGLGTTFSLISVAVMWISIAYRSIAGATFKGVAEILTLIGLIAAQHISRRLGLDRTRQLILFIVLGCLFRAVGMLFANVILLPFFYGMTIELAIAGSWVYLPWNIVQAIINVVGGWTLYNLIPDELIMQAGFGEKYQKDSVGDTDLIPEEDGTTIDTTRD